MRPGGHYINKLVAELLERVEGLDTDVVESLGMCERFIEMLCEEVTHVDACLRCVSRTCPPRTWTPGP